MAYADVNGLSMYYEEHGSAAVTEENPALILLHGGLGGADMFAPILPALSAHRRVIAVDLQAHSHTADIDRPLRFETCADDVAELIRHLDLGRADVMGYSLGGSVALRTAIQHPELVRKLVAVSIPFQRKGFDGDILTQQEQLAPAAAEFMKETPMWELYSRTAPRVEDFGRLLGKVGDLLKVEYDYSDEIREMTTPTLLAFADADTFPMQHVCDFWALFGGGLHDAGWDGSARPQHQQLAILPGTTHYTVFMSPALVEAVDRFLGDAKSADWQG